MDPRLKGCIKIIEAARGNKPFTKWEQEAFQAEFNHINANAVKKGISLDEPVKLEDGRTVTHLQKEIGAIYDIVAIRKSIIQEMAETAQQGNALMDLETRIDNIRNSIATNERYEKHSWIFNRNPAKKKKQMQAKAVMGAIVDTNDTWGTIPLDKLNRVTGTEFFGDFHGRLETSFKNAEIGISHETFMSDRKNFPDFWTEYSNFELKKGVNVTQRTKNKGAYLIAQALFEEVTLKAKNSFEKAGRWMPFNRLGMKVRWNRRLALKTDKDTFIKEVAEALDDVHGDLTQRQNLARDWYEGLTNGDTTSANWRNIGDKDPVVIDKLAREHGHVTKGGTVVGKKDGYIKWKDGESFSKITSKYADDATLHQQITAHITELSRDISVTKFLGGKSHTAGLEKVKRIIGWNDGSIKRDIGSMQEAQLDASMHYLETLVRPDILEQATVTTAFNVLRNIQAGAKLGSAVVTAILDIPVFITTGRRIFNLPLFGRDGLLATVFPGSGMISGSKADRIRYARYFVEMTESWQNAAGARFILNDGLNNQKGWVRGSAAFAHFVFRGSGLNWWTKSLQSSAAGVYGRHLGELIQTGRKWNDLGEPFQKNLQKYGIVKDDWDNLIKYQNDKSIYPDGLLDANGRLDMYKLGAGEIAINKTGVAEIVDKSFQYNIRSKFVAAVADAVDTMVMKPSQFDRMAGAFFSKEYHKTGAQIVRSMTQFKAHPISFFRKTTMRAWKHNSNKDMIITVATIAASLMATAAVTVQLKEFLKGRPTYDASKPEYWARVAQEAGVLGIVSDLAMSVMGGDKMISGFQQKSSARPMNNWDVLNNIIGPLAADTLELMTSAINVGYGAIRKDKDMRQREYEDLMTLATNQVPFKSIWWSKMLWRKYVTEMFSEIINPKGYRRAQKRIQKRLRKNRGKGIMFGKPIRSPDGALMDFWKGGFN